MFHVNPSNGAIGRCRAEVEPCPYGGASGVENHYDSIKEARAAYELLMSDRTHQSLTRQGELNRFVSSSSPESERYRKADAEFEAAYSAWDAADKKIRDRSKDKQYKNSDAWFADVKERKQLFFTQLKLQDARRAALPEELREAELAEERLSAEKKRANRDSWMKQNVNEDYEYHPAITESNQWRPRATISAFSGWSEDEVSARVKKYVESGLDLTAAYREVWADAPLRKDKPIVAIDLETAAPMVDGRVDNGAYSTIIEIGYVKRWPDGRVMSKSNLYGLPDDVRDTVGSGAQHIHNIAPEELDGVKPLQDDPDRLREFIQDVDGCVLVAHNANFEKNQLLHSVPRFGKALKVGRVEFLDTREVSQWFTPSSERNTNEAYVKVHGVEYVDAHRALPDAQMSLTALLRSKGLPTDGVEPVWEDEPEIVEIR